MGQYPDGLRGPMIIHDPNDPFKGQYDEEVVVTLSDWYHSESISLVKNMLTTSNVNFIPPFPNGLLVNDGAGANITWTEGKKYRFRFISMAAFASVMVHFDSHAMQVIMTDGSYVKQKDAHQLRISPAQRYDVIICSSERDRRNYPFLMSLDQNRDWEHDPVDRVVWPFNQTGYLIMDPNGAFPQHSVETWQPADDSHFEPLDGRAVYGPVTRSIVLDFAFCRDVNNLPRACFNNDTFILQKVPTLYSAATLGEANTNPAVYGHVLPYVFKMGDVVEVVVNNLDAAIHPFHMHGHQFQVLTRPGANEGRWSGRNHTFNAHPPMRDTVNVNANSFAVLRHVVDNPGVFLFHCHIEWHVEMGLTVTFIEAPEQLRNKVFPQDHLEACRKMRIPTSGNAAGNADPFNTQGFVDVPPVDYVG
jgi:iron transport multicopper oxidase